MLGLGIFNCRSPILTLFIFMIVVSSCEVQIRKTEENCAVGIHRWFETSGCVCFNRLMCTRNMLLIESLRANRPQIVTKSLRGGSDRDVELNPPETAFNYFSESTLPASQTWTEIDFNPLNDVHTDTPRPHHLPADCMAAPNITSPYLRRHLQRNSVLHSASPATTSAPIFHAAPPAASPAAESPVGAAAPAAGLPRQPVWWSSPLPRVPPRDEAVVSTQHADLPAHPPPPSLHRLSVGNG